MYKWIDMSDEPNLVLIAYSCDEQKFEQAKISCVPKIYLKKNQPCDHGDHTNTGVLDS